MTSVALQVITELHRPLLPRIHGLGDAVMVPRGRFKAHVEPKQLFVFSASGIHMSKLPLAKVEAILLPLP